MFFESGTSVQLQIGHVLFMDLLGYSMLLLDEQRQYLEQLTEIVRGTEQVRSAKGAGKLIRLPVGDRMALVFFDSPVAPMRCAIEISKKLKEYPQLKPRMGIHSGPINEVRDVNDSENVAGGGINLAWRVMDCGDDRHILLSKRVAEDLCHSRECSRDCQVHCSKPPWNAGHPGLGWLYALMGRKDDATATAQGQRAVALKPESKDALDGSLFSGYLALIYTRVGENDVYSVDSAFTRNARGS